MNSKSPIQFVSLGPGDPELITLKAYRQLKEADVIYCPYTVAKNGRELSRSYNILSALDILDSQISKFLLPMSKNRDAAFEAYHKVYLESFDLYNQGKKVAIVAEGDVGFYSSIHSILDKFEEEGTPVQQIPGIPAFIASGAFAKMHIVQQEEKLMVIPGIITAKQLQEIIDKGTVVVIMKLSQCADEVHRLISSHPTYNYFYFENVGTDKSFYSNNTNEISEKTFPYFSIMMIKK